MKKLKTLIEDVVLRDIEDYMDNIFEEINSKKSTSSENSDALKEMHVMRDEFQEVLKDIENGTLEQDECSELLEEIHSMIEEQGELE
jgi:hypothetical protein